MVLRKQYIEKLEKSKDKQIIKVLTGVRRCGKSTLLMQFQTYLKDHGIGDNQIIAINFENVENEDLLDDKALHSYVSKRLVPGKMTYIFLDEVQMIPQFQKAVESLFIKDNVDVYITSSSAHILSGKCIEIQILPLSFAEFYELIGGDKRDAWNAYFINGGFPYTAFLEDMVIRKEYLSGIYNTILLRDIVSRKRVNDVVLLESITKFLFNHIGNVVSPKKVSDCLTSYGRKTTSVTVENHIKALMDSFLIYKAGRYDVKIKQHLKSLEKYYMVDIGLRGILLGDKALDMGYLLENIVYLELIRRGFKVDIGKVGDFEVDFMAQNSGDRIYYQVAASILDPQTYEREILPLKKISDHYPKYIITMDEIPMGEDGIKQINIIDFLLGDCT